LPEDEIENQNEVQNLHKKASKRDRGKYPGIYLELNSEDTEHWENWKNAEKYYKNGSKIIIDNFTKHPKGLRRNEYLSEDSYIQKITVLKIPLNFENLTAFVIIIVLAMFGWLYIFKLANKQYWGCKLWRGIFELDNKLADGGFSSVFLARKVSTSEVFVLKKIDMKDIAEIDDLQLEAKQIIPLNHMNIVTYEDDFIHFESTRLETKYSLIVIMEYCDGGDLTDKIREAERSNKPFTERQLMEYFCQLCLAVKYIHSREVIHRDIKSPNLFLTKDHVLKLGDFGLSTKGKNNRSKSCYSVVGTDWYMPPEVRDGRHYDANTNPSLKPSDIWCIGLILFEMVTLIPVWDLNFDITIKLMTNPSEVFDLVNDISFYDRQITNLIKKCLSIEPEKRPTIEEILKKRVVKKHLKYLWKVKKNYHKRRARVQSIHDSESFFSKHVSSSEWESEEMDTLQHIQIIEDQGEVNSAQLIPKKRNKKGKKSKNKASN
jgi:serine/threonine protein kinase